MPKLYKNIEELEAKVGRAFINATGVRDCDLLEMVCKDHGHFQIKVGLFREGLGCPTCALVGICRVPVDVDVDL